MPTRTKTPPTDSKTASSSGARARLAPFLAKQRLLFVLGAMLIAVVIGATQLSGDSRFRSSGGVTITPVGSGQTRLSAGGDGAGLVEDKTVHTLEALRQKYGDPPNANAGRLRIPAINVDAPISSHPVAADGQLQDPIGPSDVAWYDFSKLPGFGGTPGGGENAVFAAHVDRAGHLDYAGVDYNGPGIFFWLDRLNAGDVIEVTMRGRTLRYAVTWAREVPATDPDEWEDLLASDVDDESITLVTCGGDFDRATQEYASRLVVRATRG